LIETSVTTCWVSDVLGNLTLKSETLCQMFGSL
jgi:hypothetical protein